MSCGSCFYYHIGEQGQDHSKNTPGMPGDIAQALASCSLPSKEITTPGLEKGSTTTAHPVQGDHNTMQDWRKAQPPLLIQCKEITTPGLHGERLNHHCSPSARRSQHHAGLEKGSTTTAHPMQRDHNTRTGERLNHHCSSNARSHWTPHKE